MYHLKNGTLLLTQGQYKPFKLKKQRTKKALKKKGLLQIKMLAKWSLKANKNTRIACRHF